jgi:hypothetical protein
MSGLSIEVFESILVDECGAQAEGAEYALSEERRVSVLVAHEGGLVQITKVRKVKLGEAFVAVTGEEGAYFVAPDALFAVRHQGSDEESDKKPGFRR